MTGEHRTKEVRDFFQGLIREKLRSKSDRERLALALGLSGAAVQALAYRGVGSFDTFLGALLYLYDFDLNALKKVIREFSGLTRRKSAAKESDRLWFDLDQELSEQQKLYWLSLIRASTRMNLVLAEKRAAREVKQGSHLLRAAEKGPKQR